MTDVVEHTKMGKLRNKLKNSDGTKMRFGRIFDSGSSDLKPPEELTEYEELEVIPVTFDRTYGALNANSRQALLVPSPRVSSSKMSDPSTKPKRRIKPKASIARGKNNIAVSSPPHLPKSEYPTAPLDIVRDNMSPVISPVKSRTKRRRGPISFGISADSSPTRPKRKETRKKKGKDEQTKIKFNKMSTNQLLQYGGSGGSSIDYSPTLMEGEVDETSRRLHLRNKILEQKAQFNQFITLLYYYLINRDPEECSQEDVKHLIESALHSDLRIGRHRLKASCVKNNWTNITFTFAPNNAGAAESMMEASVEELQEMREKESNGSTWMYLSKIPDAVCGEECACCSTQGHIRVSRSVIGNRLELFTFDWNQVQVTRSYDPMR